MPKLLLIDDDDLFRSMLCATLEEIGHTVTEARNGNEGLKLYQDGVTDLVITDLIMPEKEGIETIMDLRKKFPGVKIIAMSGGGRVSAGDYLRIAKQMGAGKILAKPFSNDELSAAIAEMLT
jgi:CheY-like chemotaxis protein